MKKPFSKLLSLLLAVALLVQLVPTCVFATEGDSTTHSTVAEELSADSLTEQADIEDESSEPRILFEEESLREEDVKHFRLDDGSYVAIRYDTPVHYQDENGEWIDYDNTLTSVNALDGSGGSYYRVTNGDSTRIFAADANAEVLLAVQKGDYALSMTPVEDADAELPIDPNQPVVASAVETVTLASATVLELASDGKESFSDPIYAQAQPEKIYSALEYPDVVHGADLRYENYANTVKESIVIPAPQTEYVYSFRIETEGLTPYLQEDGSIALIASDGSMPYFIPAPYMIDANYEHSYDAAYTLTESGGTWILAVCADAAWMNAEERAFPVLLDPTIVETAAGNTEICAAFVRSGYPDSYDATDTYLYVGNNGNLNQKTRTYLHVNDLIDLPRGCEIYEAELSLYHSLHSDQVTGAEIEVGAYAITEAGGLTGTSGAEAWIDWADALTWNDVEGSNATTAANDILLDKVTLSSAQEPDWVTWDITTLAYQWYDSEENAENLGVMFKAIDEDAAKSRASFVGPKNGENAKHPRMKISYRNVRGIEGKYTYQTLNVGRAGTSYISDYSLENTHIVPLFSSPSNVMPFSVSLIYNSSLTGSYFSTGYVDINTRNYNRMVCGIGWKLSVQQTIAVRNVGGETYMIYTDADGTEHYFRYETGGYYADEDGLSLKITVSGTTYTMSNPYGDTWIFETGYLTEEKDAYGNALYYCYNGNAYSSNSDAWKPTSDGKNKLTAVYRQNVGSPELEQLLKIEYSGLNVYKLIGECDYDNAASVANRTVTLGMTTMETEDSPYTMLTGITFPDGAVMQYSYYDSSAPYTTRYRLKTVYDSEANYGIDYSYSYLRNVNHFYEYIMDGANVIYGAKYHAFKRAHSKTAYRYYGDDGIPYQNEIGEYQSGDSGDDLLTVKILDREGRTVSSYTANGDETEILGVATASYTENSGTSKKNNRITAEASAGQQGINLLKNSSAENGTTDWTNAETTASYHYIGDQAFMITTAALYQSVRLTAGEDYTFSAYIHVPASASFSTTGGVRLAFLSSSGTELTAGEVVNYSTTAINEGWIRLTASYKPTNTAYYRVAVVPEGGTGAIYADALQVETGEAASTYNIIEDGSFETYNANTTLPATASFGWSSNASAKVVSPAAPLFGSKYIHLDGDRDSIRLNQVVRLALPGNTSFLFSGWAKANAKPGSATEITETEKPFFAMLLRLQYSDGTSEPYYFTFDPYYGDWQYKQGIVEAKRDKDVTITYAYVVAAYDKNINDVCFDNFSLRIEPVYSYNYNDNGDPTSATGTDTGTQSGEYTGVDLTKQTNPNGNVYKYTYDDKHAVVSSTIDGFKTTNTYDGSGNVTQVELTGTGLEQSIVTSSEISSDKNFTTVVKDDLNNKTKYDYHNYYGTLSKATDGNETATYHNYYDSNGRARQSYITDTVAIGRRYTDGRLSQLERKTFNHSKSPILQYYNFGANAWGQTTSVSVGTQILTSYEYEDVNAASETGGGNLKKVTYANGDSVSYTYDAFDRVTQMVYNDTGEVLRYYYNAEGALARLSYGDGSGSSDMNYYFDYDSSGRLVRSTKQDSENLYLRTEHVYDEFDRIYSQQWFMDGKTHREQYLYSDGATGDGSLTHFRTSSGQWVYYNYDDLKRLGEANVKNSSGELLFKTAYAYQNVSADRTSMQVEYRNVRDAAENLITGYRYVYDAVGNIIEIRQSEGNHNLLYQYTYDTQNQLLTDTRYDGNGDDLSNITECYSYTYDTAGNICSESKTVTADGKTTTVYEKEYAYSDGDWKDLLVGVRNVTTDTTQSITYDASGNPLSYWNGTKSYTNLTWEHGRQLASITTGGKTYSYDYDADGIRTQKIVDGVTHSYYTLNGRVVRESYPYGDTTVILHFTYDEQGRPFGLRYSKDGGSNYAQYYYATNYQGDVEGIFFTRKNSETNRQEIHWMGWYSYDAWGNVTVTDANGYPPTNPANLMLRNPIRYRGYYYDSETGFYYLQSRYYDPANHRFINADSSEYAGNASNLFAYCDNNPINCSDFSGEAPWGLLPDRGFIHRAVQNDIKTRSRLFDIILVTEAEILLSDGKKGRADLCNLKTSEIWEVKSCGPASLLASGQLKKYTEGTIKSTSRSPHIGSLYFSGIFDIDIFTVVYWTTCPGVILYDFWVTKGKEPQKATVKVPATSPARDNLSYYTREMDTGPSYISIAAPVIVFGGGGRLLTNDKCFMLK